MAETLSRETLTPKDKELLEKTLVKIPSEMTEGDKGVIRARRSYLSAIELANFEEVLNGEKAVVEEEKTLMDRTVGELKQMCVEKGIEIPKDVKTKAGLIGLLEPAPPVEK